MPSQPTEISLELRCDQQFGPYANIEPELANRLADIFEDDGAECALDFDGAERIREAGRCLVIFPGRLTEVRRRLERHGATVATGPDTTPPEQRYTGPVAALLERGDPSEEDGTELRQAWTDGHTAELIRMATDEALLRGPSNSLVVWAPFHAMEALGDLAAGGAVEPLAELWRRPWIEDDDYLADAVGSALVRIGPAGIAVSSRALCDAGAGNSVRCGAMKALEGIGQRHPAARAECVAAMVAALARPGINDGFINGMLISGLLGLKAVEEADAIERAFREGPVDESVCGDWEDAQIELGLKTRREHPRKPNALSEIGRPFHEVMGALSPSPVRAEPKSAATSRARAAAGRSSRSAAGPERARGPRRFALRALAAAGGAAHARRMNVPRILWLLVSVLAGLPAAAAENAPRPHVLFILADDLGWGDVGFHGGEIKTPHLDALARAGTRLDQFYVQPVCSPTRAAFMTGRYPIRHGLQTGVVRPWARYGLPLDERTLPQALKEAGYATAIVGKWHLGHFEPAYLPTRRGFDRQYGHYNGALDYHTHERDGGHDWHRDDQANRDEGYATHLLAREAVRIVAEHDARRPLFLYVPFNAVHSPFQVPARYTEPYAHFTGNRRLYAGMLAAMDEAIGQIVGALGQKGIRDDTLIFFCSDNGGPAPGVVTSNGPLRAGKGTLYEGGVRVPAVAAWTGKIKPGSVVAAPLHIVDWYPTLLKLAGLSLAQPHPLDGRDAWPAITQGAPSPHEDILINITPVGGAIRVGDWKLVVGGRFSEVGGPEPAGSGAAAKKKKNARKTGDGPAERVELFDIANDPHEKTNLAASEPARVKAMQARLDAYAKAAVPAKQAPAAPGFKSPAVWGEPGR